MLLICNGWLGSTRQNDRIFGPLSPSDTTEGGPGAERSSV